jgi:hypothetical protein
VNDLFAMAVWVGTSNARATRIVVTAFLAAQTIKLLPVMKNIRKVLLPIAVLAVSFVALAQARGLAGYGASGSNVEEFSSLFAMQRDGISLDEAVRRAEAQYHAKVVRTDVQDEDGRKVYVLKLLSEDGRVITVRIDAATGGSR